MIINPINIYDLKNLSNHFIHIDPNDIKLSELNQNYILKTLHDYKELDENNHWIYINREQFHNIFGYTGECQAAFVKPSPETTVGASYLSIDMYYNHWPYEKDPKYGTTTFTITDVWYSDLDTSYINDAEQLKNFFDKYDIYHL